MTRHGENFFGAVRRYCAACKGLTDHKIVMLGDGLRRRAWNECEKCRKLTPRERRKSDWGGV